MTVLRQQDYLCGQCKIPFLPDDPIHFHHIVRVLMVALMRRVIGWRFILIVIISSISDLDTCPQGLSRTVSTQTFAVHAMQTGLRQETYSVNGGTISLIPSQPFKPGELVQVSATTGTLNLSAAGPMNSTVWQFRTAAGRGTGLFDFSQQSVGGGSLDVDGDLDVFTLSLNLVWLNDGSGNFSDSGQNLGDSNSFAIE